ncbi:hypothetical protein ABW19_dt0207944 [Dactylella cylindrospora]|nr:hypothetical protein ABW19_dt0207944 [Dactylella cylindrospora]
MPPPAGQYLDSDESDEDNGITWVTGTIHSSQTDKFKYICALCPEKKFKTHNNLVEHKIRVGHEYCKRCDEDFPDAETRERHILGSNKHITCFICKLEFQTNAGLVLHMAHIHQQGDPGLCPECLEQFPSQSGLLQHVEGNLCSGGLKAKDIRAAILSSQRVENERLRLENQGRVGRATEMVEVEREDFINSFSHFKIYDEKVDPEIPRPHPDSRIRANANWYHADLRAWKCPFPDCGRKFAVITGFEQHLNSGTHNMKSFVCPGCKSKFTTTSAMLQHIESNVCRLKKDTQAYDMVKQSLVGPVDGIKPPSVQASRAPSRVAVSTRASSVSGPRTERSDSPPPIPPLSTVL